MQLDKSIVIIILWFGDYPWYFRYFLDSCKFNPSITFIIVGDNDKIHEKPDNVLTYYCSLDELNRRISLKFGIKSNVSTPYKVCDFKPTYGFLFQSEIQAFDFWGYGDLDVIYGDIRSFLSYEVLSTHQVFSFRPEYLSGALTIFKNNNKLNNFFRQSKDWEVICSSSKYFNFDECGFLFVPLWDGVAIETIPSEIESMTHLILKEKFSLNPYLDFNLIEGDIGEVQVKNGKIFYKNKYEAILYHFLKFKVTCKNKKYIKNAYSDNILIGNNNIRLLV